MHPITTDTSDFENPDAFVAHIGQLRNTWCEKGLFDEISPMDYLLEPEDFENLVRSVDGTAGFALFLFERRMLNILDALKDGPLRRE